MFVLTQVKMTKRSNPKAGRVPISKRRKADEPQDSKFVFDANVPRKVRYRLANASSEKGTLDQESQGSSSRKTPPIQLKLTISNHTNQLSNEDFLDDHMDELDQRIGEWTPQILSSNHSTLNYLEICNAAERVAKYDPAITKDLGKRIWQWNFFDYTSDVLRNTGFSSKSKDNDDETGLRLVKAHQEIHTTLQRLASLVYSIDPRGVHIGFGHLDDTFYNHKAYPAIIKFAASMAVSALEKGPEEHIELLRYAMNLLWRSRHVSPKEIGQVISKTFTDHVCITSKLWHKRQPWKNDETGRKEMVQFIEMLTPTFQFIYATLLDLTKNKEFAYGVTHSVSLCVFTRVEDELTKSIVWVISSQDKTLTEVISKMPNSHFCPRAAVRLYATMELVRMVKTCNTIDEMIKTMTEMRAKMRPFVNATMPNDTAAEELVEEEWVIDKIPSIQDRDIPRDLVKHFDRALRRSLSSDRFREKRAMGLTLYNLFDPQNREETMKLYSDSLTNRLLTAKFDMEKEEKILRSLIEYENSPLSKVKSLHFSMQTKLKDMKKSTDLSKDYVTANKESKGPFASKILTPTVWPELQEKTAPAMILPPEIQKLRDQLEQFYVSNHENRHLKWDTSHDLVMIQGQFGKERKELYVNGFQACIILQFNEDLDEEEDAGDGDGETDTPKRKEPIQLTYSQISAACGMAKQELNAALHSLVSGRVSILGVKRAGERPVLPNKIEDYADADVFQILDKIKTPAAGASKKGSMRGRVEMLKLNGYQNNARDPAATKDKSKPQENGKKKTAKQIRQEELFEATLRALTSLHEIEYDDLFQQVTASMNLWSLGKKIRITHKEVKELLEDMNGRPLGPNGHYLRHRRRCLSSSKIIDVYSVQAAPTCPLEFFLPEDDEYEDEDDEDEDEDDGYYFGIGGFP